MSEYNDDSIFTPERLDVVRLRPTKYFPSTDISGLLHQALEIITNAIDEVALMPAGLGKILVLFCIDAEQGTYQIVVRDNGRGLPIKRLLDSYTKVDTSGKFNQGAYETSGGMFGVGAKASAGTSRYFRAITHRPEASASLYVFEGKTDEVIEHVDIPPAQTGVTVIFEPDPIIFPTDIGLFSTVGQEQLLTLLQKYCFFGTYDIEFRVYPLGLPKAIWTTPLHDAERLVTAVAQAANLVFNQENFDRIAWLRSYWNLQRPFALQHVLRSAVPVTITRPEVREVTMRYELMLFTVKFDVLGGRFGMVNNVPIDDGRSSHFAGAMDTFKIALGNFIKDGAIRKWFLEHYRLPLYMAVDIKFPGVELAGTTKSAFTSAAFRNAYAASIQALLDVPENTAFVTALYAQYAEHIESSYTASVIGVTAPKNYNRLFEMFKNLHQRWTDCGTTNRRIAELFLVEGDSAGNSVQGGRNSNTQGVYRLRGKPFNGVLDKDNMVQSAVNIKERELWKELIAILGLNPAKFDPETLMYGGIYILTDADDHGCHIASIVIGDFYVLCPDMISAGFIHIVHPPLYSLMHKNKRLNLPKIYLRNEQALREWLIEHVYTKAISIGVKLKGSEDKPHLLPGLAYQSFLQDVLDIGAAITNVAAELVLDPLVVERLTHVTSILEANNGLPDLDRLNQIPDVDRVSYEPNGNIVVLTVGDVDHIVPLQNVRKRLIDVVMPLLNRIQWRKIEIYITTKYTNEYKNQPFSIMRLYRLLLALDEQFKIERYKGIGSMAPTDMGRVVLDPASRIVHQITSPGDVDVIFNLLGRDSAGRKELTRED
jgi:DNA gyrase/topoisomerase IV subunit B